MDFETNLTIFYQADPHFRVKLSSSVAVPAKTNMYMGVECCYTIPKSTLPH